MFHITANSYTFFHNADYAARIIAAERVLTRNRPSQSEYRVVKTVDGLGFKVEVIQCGMVIGYL